MAGMYSGESKPSDEVGGPDDRADAEGDRAEGEGGARGLEVAAGVDDDLRVVVAVGAGADEGGEGRVGGLEQAAAADDDLRAAVVVVVVEAHGVARSEADGAVVGQRHVRLVGRRADPEMDVGPDGQGRPLVDGEVAGEDVAEVGRGLGADGVQLTVWPLVSVSGWM